jgi:Fur family ferric uptake transcriptional regulator
MIRTTMAAGTDSHTLLRRAGLRSTPQRQTVLDLLGDGDHRHLTADDIWRAAASLNASFNRSTAYRVLDQLCDAGIVQQTRFGDSAHFEIAGDPERHYHLVCRGCRSIENLPSEVLAEITGRLARQHGFAVRSVDLTIEGECRACRRGVSSTA